MSKFYYHDNNGNAKGPFSLETLKLLVEEGIIKKNTVIEKEDGNSYFAINIVGLFNDPAISKSPALLTTVLQNLWHSPDDSNQTVEQKKRMYTIGILSFILIMGVIFFISALFDIPVFVIILFILASLGGRRRGRGRTVPRFKR